MTLRPIDVNRFEAVTPADQPVPMLQWVRIDALGIDDAYQRPLGKHNLRAIRAIAAAFSWSKFSPVLVAPAPGGRFAVIDGQHRVHAAAVCGFEEVPAQVVLLSRAEQARAFVGVNTSAVRPSLPQVYRAALAAGEPWAVGAQAAVEEAGCELLPYHPSGRLRKARQLTCIALARKLVDADRAWAVTAALRALDAYDGERVALWTEYVITPWMAAVARDAAFAAVDLAAVLRANPPYKVIEVAERRRRTEPRHRAADAFEAPLRAALRSEAA